jgi:hypothetical protein
MIGMANLRRPFRACFNLRVIPGLAPWALLLRAFSARNAVSLTRIPAGALILASQPGAARCALAPGYFPSPLRGAEIEDYFHLRPFTSENQDGRSGEIESCFHLHQATSKNQNDRPSYTKSLIA